MWHYFGRFLIKPVPLSDDCGREVHDGGVVEGDDAHLGPFRNGGDEVMQRPVQQGPAILQQHRLASVQQQDVAAGLR